MAKKKKAKVVQMLSPENYIKQRARTLPIDECWINSDWEETKKAVIIIARKHTNGNYTIGIYLVDLYCFGVTDSHFEFNITEFKYREFLESYDEDMRSEKVNYSLVHNIIFATIEFADDYGFKPHKTYNALTRYILEEDTDDVELLEIDCGTNNEPVYLRDIDDSDADAAKIIAQLEKTAGKGNFHVIDPTQDKSEAFGVDEFTDDYEEITVDEQLQEFNKQVDSFEHMNELEREDFVDLVDSIIEDVVDYIPIDHHVDSFLDFMEDIEITDELSDEVLGISKSANKQEDKLKSEFFNILEKIDSDTEKAKNKIDGLKKHLPSNAAVCYLELEYLQMIELDNSNLLINDCVAKFPNNPLIKLKKFEQDIIDEDKDTRRISIVESLQLVLGNRKEISYYELTKILMSFIIGAIKFKDISLLEALNVIIIESYNEYFESMNAFIFLGRMDYLSSISHDSVLKQLPNKQRSIAYQFKIQIKQITKPPVWRRIKVPSNYSFYDFHRVIQTAFGWENYHLFQFSPKGFGSYPLIQLSHENNYVDGIDTLDANEIKLSEIFHSEKQKYTYIYDFGDDWEHSVLLEKVEAETIRFPELMAGKSKCPPEDCGGIHGYENLKGNLSELNNDDDSEFREWLGMEADEVWDANEFNLALVQKELANTFGTN